jgi:TolB-like protein/Flp pilus assembly protein TadD
VPDLRAVLDSALAGRYTIERELGRGGMATVFLARDLRHDRPVALKVLHAQLAAMLGPERFQREIRFAARLQHPHILTVLDSGEAGDQHRFTMPFVEGESLRDRLNRQKQLPLADALRIARETADALDYAHQHGVVHRDIKPENILLAARHALVADFGIARALGGGTEGRRAGGQDAALTETGMSLGTPPYMSPEQASGERELDQRSDIYSLGCVLFEMLAGEPPFSGPTAQVVLMRRFTETPRPIRQLRDTVPAEVEAAVAKALQRSPADRFESAAEFGRALEGGVTAAGGAPGTAAPTSGPTAALGTRAAATPPLLRRYPMVVTLLAGFAIGLGVLFAWRRGHPGADMAEDAGPKLVAVLPFENLGSADDEYFADGITDEVRGKLATVPGLKVIARSSSAQYKKSGKSPQAIARELGVQYLLTATVRWEKAAGGNRVRVSPELVQMAPGSAPTTKWQQPFDAALTDVFQVQADIAGRVAQALDVALGQAPRQTLAEKPTANLAAYDAYLKGEEESQGLAIADPPTLRRAIGYYEQAVALDSTFALAWAQLSRAHATAYYNGAALQADAEQARFASGRALQLAPNRPESHNAVADYLYFVESDFTGALVEYDAGLRLAPTSASLLSNAAIAKQSLGRWDEAYELLARARGIDPRSLQVARRLAASLVRLRRLPEAAEAAQQGLSIAPGNLQILEVKAMVSLAQGDLSGARAALAAAPREVEPTALAAYVATVWDLYWVLDSAHQSLLLRLPPSQFDGDRGNWGLALAHTYYLRNERAKASAYADSARQALEEQLKGTPDNAQAHALLGSALAYMGRKADAIREGRRSVELVPIARDGYTGPYLQHQLARIYILVGDYDAALDQLEPLLKTPYFLTPAWLKIDPLFDPLRKNSRFQRLAAGS